MLAELARTASDKWLRREATAALAKVGDVGVQVLAELARTASKEEVRLCAAVALVDAGGLTMGMSVDMVTPNSAARARMQATETYSTTDLLAAHLALLHIAWSSPLDGNGADAALALAKSLLQMGTQS